MQEGLILIALKKQIVKVVVRSTILGAKKPSNSSSKKVRNKRKRQRMGRPFLMETMMRRDQIRWLRLRWSTGMRTRYKRQTATGCWETLACRAEWSKERKTDKSMRFTSQKNSLKKKSNLKYLHRTKIKGINSPVAGQRLCSVVNHHLKLGPLWMSTLLVRKQAKKRIN